MRRAIQLAEVKKLVIEKRAIMPRVGTRKIYHIIGDQLKERKIKIGRDNLFAYLACEHLLIKPLRSYRKTTNSKHWLHKYPNLLKNVEITEAEQVWVADITYIETVEQTGYLSLITDAYSRKIVGHHLHPSLHTDGVAKALKTALKNRCKETPLIHHSDRGLQYCSEQYQKIQRTSNITCSMTDGYDCYQNALAERMNGILKQEFLVVKPKNLDQAKIIIEESINIYNKIRPHLSLGFKTPDYVHYTG